LLPSFAFYGFPRHEPTVQGGDVGLLDGDVGIPREPRSPLRGATLRSPCSTNLGILQPILAITRRVPSCTSRRWAGWGMTRPSPAAVRACVFLSRSEGSLPLARAVAALPCLTTRWPPVESSTAECWVLQATPQWSNEHIEVRLLAAAPSLGRDTPRAYRFQDKADDAIAHLTQAFFEVYICISIFLTPNTCNESIWIPP
jgi:hypothetical protein